jgi:hypothetical protein
MRLNFLLVTMALAATFTATAVAFAQPGPKLGRPRSRVGHQSDHPAASRIGKLAPCARDERRRTQTLMNGSVNRCAVS